jgi:hypothetical protein
VALKNVESTVSEVQRLKHEIDRLTRLQADALQHAIYLGMTPNEAKEYDERRSMLTRLVEQLGALTQAL